MRTGALGASDHHTMRSSARIFLVNMSWELPSMVCSRSVNRTGSSLGAWRYEARSGTPVPPVEETPGVQLNLVHGRHHVGLRKQPLQVRDLEVRHPNRRHPAVG